MMPICAFVARMRRQTSNPSMPGSEQRHADIVVLLQLFQRLLARLGLDDLIPGAAQIDDNKTADAGLVLQYHYLFHGVSFQYFSVLQPLTTRLKFWRSSASSSPTSAAPSSSAL